MVDLPLRFLYHLRDPANFAPYQEMLYRSLGKYFA